MTIQVSEKQAREYLSDAIGRLTVENEALRTELAKVQAERDLLSATLGDMHRKLEEVDAEAAKEFLGSLDGRQFGG